MRQNIVKNTFPRNFRVDASIKCLGCTMHDLKRVRPCRTCGTEDHYSVLVSIKKVTPGIVSKTNSTLRQQMIKIFQNGASNNAQHFLKQSHRPRSSQGLLAQFLVGWHVQNP
eukprot:6405063-Amphidinium_carterae.1